MTGDSLVWAAVPHNTDGVVFQVRLERGLQRFHVSRSVLEEIFSLERRASDTAQLQHFYLYFNRILARANAKRSVAGADTVSLKATDFTSGSKGKRNSTSVGMGYGVA